MSDLQWEWFIAYASPDRPHANALYEALRGVRVFLDHESLQGDDRPWDQAIPAALAASAGVILLVSEHSAAAHYQRDEVVAMINRHRTTRQVVVPVLLPGATLEHVPYGARVFQSMQVDKLGLDEVARRLRERAERWKAGTIQVAVWGVSAELGALHDDVTSRIHNLQLVRQALRVDAAQPRQVDADLEIVLLGGRTGGTEALKAALDRGAWAIKQAQPVYDRQEPSEMEGGLGPPRPGERGGGLHTKTWPSKPWRPCLPICGSAVARGVGPGCSPSGNASTCSNAWRPGSREASRGSPRARGQPSCGVRTCTCRCLRRRPWCMPTKRGPCRSRRRARARRGETNGDRSISSAGCATRSSGSRRWRAGRGPARPCCSSTWRPCWPRPTWGRRVPRIRSTWLSCGRGLRSCRCRSSSRRGGSRRWWGAEVG